MSGQESRAEGPVSRNEDPGRVVCRELIVVDKVGEPRIRLSVEEKRLETPKIELLGRDGEALLSIELRPLDCPSENGEGMVRSERPLIRIKDPEAAEEMIVGMCVPDLKLGVQIWGHKVPGLIVYSHEDWRPLIQYQTSDGQIHCAGIVDDDRDDTWWQEGGEPPQ